MTSASRAALEFDCFLTVDSNLQFQQSPGQLPLAVLVLRVPDDRFVTLKTVMPLVREAMLVFERGELRVIGA